MRRGADRGTDACRGSSHRPGCHLIGQVAARLASIDVACHRCSRRGRLRTGRLVAEHGTAISVPALLRIIAADCPRMRAAQMHDVCGVHLPELSGLGLS